VTSVGSGQRSSFLLEGYSVNVVLRFVALRPPNPPIARHRPIFRAIATRHRRSPHTLRTTATVSRLRSSSSKASSTGAPEGLVARCHDMLACRIAFGVTGQSATDVPLLRRSRDECGPASQFLVYRYRSLCMSMIGCCGCGMAPEKVGDTVERLLGRPGRHRLRPRILVGEGLDQREAHHVQIFCPLARSQGRE
jgi:hypothetical protein